MYKQIPSEDLIGLDLVEQAVVSVPPRHFTEHNGIMFEGDCDDLDYYDGAFFTLNGETPFALIHYRGNPENHTAIYLDRRLQGERLQRTVEQILRIFELPTSSLTWIQPDHQASR